MRLGPRPTNPPAFTLCIRASTSGVRTASCNGGGHCVGSDRSLTQSWTARLSYGPTLWGAIWIDRPGCGALIAGGWSDTPHCCGYEKAVRRGGHLRLTQVPLGSVSSLTPAACTPWRINGPAPRTHADICDQKGGHVNPSKPGPPNLTRGHLRRVVGLLPSVGRVLVLEARQGDRRALRINQDQPKRTPLMTFDRQRHADHYEDPPSRKQRTSRLK